MGIKVGCEQCSQLLEPWEAGICEGCGLSELAEKKLSPKLDKIDGMCLPTASEWRYNSCQTRATQGCKRITNNHGSGDHENKNL